MAQVAFLTVSDRVLAVLIILSVILGLRVWSPNMAGLN